MASVRGNHLHLVWLLKVAEKVFRHWLLSRPEVVDSVSVLDLHVAINRVVHDDMSVSLVKEAPERRGIREVRAVEFSVSRIGQCIDDARYDFAF